MDKIKNLTVSEAFYSIQGEGKTMGRPSVFIRLAGCNLMCGGKGTEKDGQLHNGATWRCDSIEVWQKGKSFSPEDLTEKLNAQFNFVDKLRQGAQLIITGGEPLLQKQGILDLVRYLKAHLGLRPSIEIETNGTLYPGREFEYELHPQYNVSPKLSNSGEPYDLRIKKEVLHQLANLSSNVQFKFVVSSEQDIKEILDIMRESGCPPRLVWLMPAASDQSELLLLSEKVVEMCISLGFNYSHRLHIAIWNKKTGV